jgi:hypothetical protein
MSKIKDLRNSDENNIGIIRMLEQLLVSDKTKYIELLRKLVINRIDNEEQKKVIYEDLYSRLPSSSFSDDMNMFELIFLSSLISWIDHENIISFNQFVSYNERKLVEKNDLTTYKSFDEISCEISKVELKTITKEMESQVVTLYSSDEWLVIKPLTYESSKKYGSNTKWCTTSAQNPDYFFRYTKNGILVYCVNKKNGYKVAAFKDMKDRDVSFWNQKDERIDSFYTELSDEIISILRKEFKTCSKPNGGLIDASTREKEMLKYFKGNQKGIEIDQEVAPRRIQVDNRYDEGDIEQPMEPDEREIGGHEMIERTEDRDMMDYNPQLTKNQILELLSVSNPLSEPQRGIVGYQGVMEREEIRNDNRPNRA